MNAVTMDGLKQGPTLWT